MTRMDCRRLGIASAVLLAVGIAGVFQDIGAQGQGPGRAEDDPNLTYSRGQSVIPMYEGWHPNPDGTIDLWFAYLNQNWQERLHLPIGPNNRIEPAPYGPDGGQPTHFLPRMNYFAFAVRVPKDFDPKREVSWTITSYGQTLSAYATLNPGYLKDDIGMQREHFGTPPPGNKAPVLTVEGEKQRTVKVGQSIELAAVATDDGLPRLGPSGTQADRDPAQRRNAGGGGGGRNGLRLAWYVYRGTNAVVFDPPQFKTWEDRYGGSPWAAFWVNPPIPAGNRWVTHATFRVPGTYVLQAQTTDGKWLTTENVTFTVTP